MEYLRKKILNKRKLALLIGMSPSLFDAKLNHRNYNKFNPNELDLINKKIKEQFQDMPDVLKVLLLILKSLFITIPLDQRVLLKTLTFLDA